MKITISVPVLINALLEAADSLRVAHKNGLNTVTFTPNITLTSFLWFCLGSEKVLWK